MRQVDKIRIMVHQCLLNSNELYIQTINSRSKLEAILRSSRVLTLLRVSSRYNKLLNKRQERRRDKRNEISRIRKVDQLVVWQH